jgi:cell volume regulation protein A
VPEAEPLLAAAALLVLVGVAASKLSARLGVPSLVLFLAIGMLAGSDGVGGIHFDDHELAQSVGIVALAFILFSGGLDTHWQDVRPVLVPGALLATVGAVVTALVTGAFATWVLDFPLTTGLLLGAIVSSTDAAAVFSVVRSHQVNLGERVRSLLELESGANDPMAVFLTIGFLTLLGDPGTSTLALLPLFVQQMAGGGVVGYLSARLAVVMLNRLHLEYDGLYPVVTLAMVLFTYGTATLLGGSGFLAVYMAGLTLGRVRFLHKKSLTRFHDAIAWLAQISMFLLLGLLVFPSDLMGVAGPALAVSAVLVLVARPVAVFAAVPGRRLALREKALVSWVGLRGAAPVVLATFPLVEGVEHAEEIFDIVFFIVLTSVLVQGTTVPLVARRLGVDAPMPVPRAAPLEFVTETDADMDLHQFEVTAGSPSAGRRLIALGLPPGVLVVLVTRDGSYVVPQGATVLHPGDAVLAIASEEALTELRAILGPEVGAP